MKAVSGLPRSGKTTSHPDCLHADDWLEQGHNYAVGRTIAELRKGNSVEGVSVVLALDKYGIPKGLSEFHWHGKPKVELTQAQEGLAKRLQNAWGRVVTRLLLHGVRVSNH